MTELFQRYYPNLHTRALSILGDRMLSDDVVQDVFIKLWESRRRNPAPGYLFSSVRNRALDVLREVKRRERLLEGYARVQDTEMYTTLDEGEPSVRERLYTMADTLSPRRREVFILNRLEGLTAKEIAEYLDISLGTVQDHIRIGTSRIKEQFKSKYINNE